MFVLGCVHARAHMLMVLQAATATMHGIQTAPALGAVVTLQLLLRLFVSLSPVSIHIHISHSFGWSTLQRCVHAVFEDILHASL
jgi:hypothetical protein